MKSHREAAFLCFRFVRLLFLLVLPGPGCASAAFRVQEVDQKSIGIWEREQPVLVYNFGVVTNSEAGTNQPHSAYIHPLYGLKGEGLTGDFPKDHPYHRGLYWAWSHILIGGREYDSWSIRGIETKFERWIAREAHPRSALLALQNGWYVRDRRVMDERVRIEVHPATAEGRAIDLHLTWKPTDQPVTLSGAPGKSYGGLTLRFGNRTQTVITTPSGKTSEDLVMTNLPWADLSGDLAGAGKPFSGAAIFVDPHHPDFPPTWMTRHYGVLAVGWPGVTPQTFAPGQEISVRYRIWVHNGVGDPNALQRAYDSFYGRARTENSRKVSGPK